MSAQKSVMLDLDQPVTSLKFISDKYATVLAKLNINTVRDLLTHFPRYHKDTSEITKIANIKNTGVYTFQGNIRQFKNIFTRSRKQIQKATLVDDTGRINITWFNQSFLARTFQNDPIVILSGKVEIFNGQAQMTNPQYDVLNADGESLHLGHLTPTYALTAGISVKWIRRRIRELLDNYQINLASPTDSKFGIALAQAVEQIHFPKSEEQIEMAEGRLGYEELITIMLKVLVAKAENVQTNAVKINVKSAEIAQFIKSLSFQLTIDQQAAVGQILSDLRQSQPMNRLVQGDVGSGKTIVAAIAALAAYLDGHQVAFLAPTVVLAEQHNQTLSKIFTDVPIHLITGSNKQPIEDLRGIFIGTTAVLARKHELFQNLGLVVVDEQHKFGVSQRTELRDFIQSSERVPHLLDMTATPIPRTVALTFFGDINVTTIRTKPAGRLPIRTHMIPEVKRPDSHEWISQQIKDGRQVYWVCPLVEESEVLEIKSAKQSYEVLSTQVFPQHRVGLVHGKLKDKEKIAVMDKFKRGEIDILVSTTVIEVGVDVPNATVMVIESADHMGLAQLHQIRGRVGRSDIQSWCFLYESPNITEVGKQRLEFFSHHHDGLEIAEFDLQLRGPGEVYGTRQAGIPDLKIAKMNDVKMIIKARELAQELYQQDPHTKLPLF